ncbi:MAG: hypothetical protein KA758_13520 [Acidimicrobiales bacterium]|nr:hypothetical protein [Acidimicrobiales bacterium]
MTTLPPAAPPHAAPPPAPSPGLPVDPSAFDAATAALYGAFADVPHRPAMPHCRHCVTDAHLALLAAPVAELAPEVVARFVAKAGTTWGDGHDLRRVAPRALHLAADHLLPFSRAVLLEKLAAAGWSSWPPAEVDAICRFLLAEWQRLLASPPRAGHAAHRWLRQTAAVVADLDPFLRAWSQALAGPPGPPAVHLAVVLVQSDLRPDFPSSINALFDTTEAADQFGAWLAAPATFDRLQTAADSLARTPDTRRLSLAVDRLTRYRAARARAA